MINVTVLQDSEHRCRGIAVDGHAGYAEYGQDIICSAVSALTLNMANCVEQFTEDPFDADVDEKTGHFHFRFTSKISPESKLLADSCILGLENIKSSYGKQYIRIRYEEV